MTWRVIMTSTELNADTPIGEWLRHPAGHAVLSRLLDARGVPADTLNQVAGFTLNQLAAFSNSVLTPEVVGRLVAEAQGSEFPEDTPPLSGPHQSPDALRPPVEAADGTRRFYDIEYAMIEGFRPLRMDLHLPPGTGPAPVVVYVHGGGFRFGSKSEGVVARPIWKALIEAGFAVAAVEYRLTGEAIFPACVHDVHAAVRWLRAYAGTMGISADAITAWGESAGAHLALFLGTNTSDLGIVGDDGVTGAESGVSGVVAWFAPVDFPRLAEHAGAEPGTGADAANSAESRLIGVPIRENPQLAAYASPITHVSQLSAPTLLVHGDADVLVPYQQSVCYRHALQAVEIPVELDIVPGAGHGFAGIDQEPLIRECVDFLCGVVSSRSGGS
jgi:acetyl esterase/lipase